MLVWESMNVFKIILSKRNLCPAKIFKSNNVNEWAGSRSNTSIEIVFNYYGKNQILVVSIFLFELRQIFMNLLIRKRSVSKYIFLLPLLNTLEWVAKRFSLSVIHRRHTDWLMLVYAQKLNKTFHEIKHISSRKETIVFLL